MKKGLGWKILVCCWAVLFALAFLLDISRQPVEFPGVRAVVSDALGTLAASLLITGCVWLYHRATGKRYTA